MGECLAKSEERVLRQEINVSSLHLVCKRKIERYNHRYPKAHLYAYSSKNQENRRKYTDIVTSQS